MHTGGFHVPTVLAYVDPGVGSVLIQILVAGVVGSLFAIKQVWRRLTGFFALLGKHSSAVAGKDADPR